MKKSVLLGVVLIIAGFVMLGIGGGTSVVSALGLIPPAVGIILIIKALIDKVRGEKPPASRQPKPKHSTEIRIEPAFNYMEDALRARSYVVLDTETTGLDPAAERIIEVAMIRVEDGVVTKEVETFLDPGRKIPARITELTGITNADVQGGMAQGDAAAMIADIIGDLPIVAHNAPFDAKFVSGTLSRAGIEKTVRYIDTLAIARKFYPGRNSYKLASLAADLNLADHEQTHRAMDDARMAHTLFTRCAANLLGGKE